MEAAARRIIPSRARAWLVAYSALGLVARWSRPRRRVPRRGSPLPGAVVAVAGYPLGRALLDDHPVIPPPDSAGIELAALGGTVAAAEELIWGGLVEPELGIGVTSVLFAAKHALIDGRWRRTLGLALFAAGLGLVRSCSPRSAWAVHTICNSAGVVLGHATGRDQF